MTTATLESRTGPDPFALTIQVLPWDLTQDTTPCDTSDGCSPSCASSCASRG